MEKTPNGTNTILLNDGRNKNVNIAQTIAPFLPHRRCFEKPKLTVSSFELAAFMPTTIVKYRYSKR